MARRLRIRLQIPPDRMMLYYDGSIRYVVATAESGETVRFPAAILRPHVRHDGVRGLFELSFDESHRFLGLRRLGSAA